MTGKPLLNRNTDTDGYSTIFNAGKEYEKKRKGTRMMQERAKTYQVWKFVVCFNYSTGETLQKKKSKEN